MGSRGKRTVSVGFRLTKTEHRLLASVRDGKESSSQAARRLALAMAEQLRKPEGLTLTGSVASSETP